MKELGPIVVCSNPSIVFMVDAKTFLIPLVLVSLLGDVLLETHTCISGDGFDTIHCPLIDGAKTCYRAT